jgi:lipoate-protein ligase A
MENKDNKNKEELKKKLHELIDGVEDEHILKVLNEDVIAYMITTMDEVTNEDEDDDELTEEQLKQLNDAIKEADEGKTISHEEFKKRMARWLPNIKE